MTTPIFRFAVGDKVELDEVWAGVERLSTFGTIENRSLYGLDGQQLDSPCYMVRHMVTTKTGTYEGRSVWDERTLKHVE